MLKNSRRNIKNPHSRCNASTSGDVHNVLWIHLLVDIKYIKWIKCGPVMNGIYNYYISSFSERKYWYSYSLYSVIIKWISFNKWMKWTVRFDTTNYKWLWMLTSIIYLILLKFITYKQSGFMFEYFHIQDLSIQESCLGFSTKSNKKYNFKL